MTYELHVDNKLEKQQLLPVWFIIGFTVSVIVIAILLFPIKTLRHAVLKVTQPQLITLYYLNKLVALYPSATDLRIALIKQEIGLHRFISAQDQIKLLAKTQDMEKKVQLLQFYLHYTLAFQIPMNRKLAFDRLRKELNSLISIPQQEDEILELANAALNLGEPKIALAFYTKLENIKDPKQLRYIAQTALQASDYEVSAKYYMLAMQQEKTLDLKRRDIIKALKVLQAGNLFQAGVDLIDKLPDSIINNKAMLIFISEYLLAANRSDLASVYVKRALLMKGSL